MNPYLTNVLPHSPEILNRLISTIDSSKLDIPTYPGRFSIREVVAHLAEWEPILLERMKKALHESGSEVQGLDEGEMAVAGRYSETDIEERLNAFKESRSRTVAFLNGVKPDEWERFVVHTERGKQTLYDQANLLLGHDIYHLEQVSAVL